MALEEDSANGATAIASAATPAIAYFVPETNVRSLRRNRSLERRARVQTMPYQAMTRICQSRQQPASGAEITELPGRPGRSGPGGSRRRGGQHSAGASR